MHCYPEKAALLTVHFCIDNRLTARYLSYAAMKRDCFTYDLVDVMKETNNL